jgi:hypothetical protein
VTKVFGVDFGIEGLGLFFELLAFEIVGVDVAKGLWRCPTESRIQFSAVADVHGKMSPSGMAGNSTGLHRSGLSKIFEAVFAVFVDGDDAVLFVFAQVAVLHIPFGFVEFAMGSRCDFIIHQNGEFRLCIREVIKVCAILAEPAAEIISGGGAIMNCGHFTACDFADVELVFACGDRTGQGHHFLIRGKVSHLEGIVILENELWFPVCRTHFVQVHRLRIAFVAAVIEGIFGRIKIQEIIARIVSGCEVGRLPVVEEVNMAQFIAALIRGIDDSLIVEIRLRPSRMNVALCKQRLHGITREGSHFSISDIDFIEVVNAGFVAVDQEFGFVLRPSATADIRIFVELLDGVLLDDTGWGALRRVLAAKDTQCEQECEREQRLTE